MQVSQQIVGVNQRLGNTAVPNMQGTTRAIFDTATVAASADQTLNFFNGVTARPWPLSNINQNKFEVGESLAIQGISYLFRPTDLTNNAESFQATPTPGTVTVTYTMLFNLYIGNQRVVKDMEIANYAKFHIGESAATSISTSVIRLETPIIIPPQIEFYATCRLLVSSAPVAQRLLMCLFGTGTLLNPKSNY